MRNWDDCLQTIPGSTEKIPTLKCLEVVFENILTVAVSLAALALFVMLLVGGFRYLTSAGDPKAAGQARQTMTYAIIGIALMALAFLIFFIIEQFTGVAILNFEIPDIQ